MRTPFIILLSVTAISAVNVGYVAPVASGYIYRSDNNGPASLIQLGAIPYQKLQTFAPPLPLAQPKLQALEAYDLEPAPLPYIAAQPIIVEDAAEEEDEDSDDSSEDYLDGGLTYPGHAYENGASSEYGEGHLAVNGGKGSTGYNTKENHAKGEAGVYANEHNEGFYSEGETEHKAHRDEADAHEQQFELGGAYKGENHGHKKHFSKGEDITGYHKVFHKDEFKKDHDFYDVADNSGHFKKHEYENVKHGSDKSGHKRGGSHDSAFDKGSSGRAGFLAKGRVNVGGVDHSAEEGRESHYNHHQDFGKQHGRGHDKEYAYNDEDEED